MFVNKNTWPLYDVKPEEKSQGGIEQQFDQKTLEEYVKDRGGDRVIKKYSSGSQFTAAYSFLNLQTDESILTKGDSATP